MLDSIRASFNINKQDTFRIPYALFDTFMEVSKSNRKRLVRALVEKKIIQQIKEGPDKGKYKWDKQGLDHYLCVQEDSLEVKEERYLRKQNKPAPVRVQQEDYYFDESGMRRYQETGEIVQHYVGHN
jgi:hypothetical protein